MDPVIAKCGSCKAPIIWALTDNNRRIPVDANPVSMGNLALSTETHPPRVKQANAGTPDGRRFVSHFATCPDAKTWRHR